MNKNLRGFFAAAVLALVLFPAHAKAGPAKDAVETFMKEIQTVDFSGAAEKIDAQSAKAHVFLDLESLSQKALAKHWTEAPEGDRKEFLDLMWQLIQYVAYPKSQRLTKGYVIEYPSDKEDAESAEIRSVIKQQEQGLDITVVYRLGSQNGQWKINDVILDDVSITEDLQAQFDKIIADSGFSGLLEKMRDRLNTARKTAATSQASPSSSPAP